MLRVETKSENVEKQLTCIALPCFLWNTTRAIESLGGLQTIQNTIEQSNDKIFFQFPTKKLISSRLEGTSQSRNLLVVKIVRRKKKSQASNEHDSQSSDTKVELIGLVNRHITFPEPMDYQFLPLKNYKPQTDILEVIPERFDRAENFSKQQLMTFNYQPTPILNPASSITKLSQEIALSSSSSSSSSSKAEKAEKAKPNKNQKALTDEGNEEGDEELDGDEDNEDIGTGGDEEGVRYTLSANGRKKYLSNVIIIRFNDPIPVNNPHGSTPTRWAKLPPSYRGLVMIDRLNKLFQMIPILTRNQVLELLSLGNKVHLLRECIPYVAYTYSNGPFAHCWIRFGYDPRKDIRTFIFQSIKMKFQSQVLQAIDTRMVTFLSQDRLSRKMIDLSSMTVKDAPPTLAVIGKGANARTPLSLFGQILKIQVAFQIHTLRDEVARRFVQNMDLTSRCSESTGWFTSQSAESFRTFMTGLLERKVQEFLDQSDVTYEFPTASSDDNVYEEHSQKPTNAYSDVMKQSSESSDLAEMMLLTKGRFVLDEWAQRPNYLPDIERYLHKGGFDWMNVSDDGHVNKSSNMNGTNEVSSSIILPARITTILDDILQFHQVACEMTANLQNIIADMILANRQGGALQNNSTVLNRIVYRPKSVASTLTAQYETEEESTEKGDEGANSLHMGINTLNRKNYSNSSINHSSRSDTTKSVAAKKGKPMKVSKPLSQLDEVPAFEIFNQSSSSDEEY